jgi:hypothetical protein
VVSLGGAELLDEQRHAVRTKGRGCLQAVAAGQGRAVTTTIKPFTAPSGV